MVNPIICKCFPHSDIDWNNRPKNPTNVFEDRLADAYMGKSLQSDMAFYVESDKTTIPAHSLIVSAASEVLEKLIHGTGSIVNTDRVVSVPDCPLEEFLVLLRYLYTGNIQLNVLTIEQATILILLAHYFGLHHFEDICGKRIAETLTPTNVCNTFDQIHFMDNVATNKCMDIMLFETQVILKNGSLMKMQAAAVEKILSRNELSIVCESELMKPMVDWADKECIDQKLDVTPANRRSVIKDRIYLIRFGAMQANAFGNCVSLAGTGFFAFEEIGDTMVAICGTQAGKVIDNYRKFSCRRRMYREKISAVNASYNVRPVFEFEENIALTNKDECVALLGFETTATNNVSNIFDISKTRELSFRQSGNKIIFIRPIEFSGGECAFVICFKDKQALVCAQANESKMFTLNKLKSYYTLITALLYTYLK